MSVRVVLFPALLAALVVALLLVSGAVNVAEPGTPPSGPSSISSLASTPSGKVVVGAFSSAVPISPEFWGVNVVANRPFTNTDAADIMATPAQYVRFPGGILGEELNYTSGAITFTNGNQSHAVTSVKAFVASCEVIDCKAIMQLPTEIDSPSTAAYYASYVVHNLSYQPAYWDLGDAPAGWTHYGVPWSEWGTEGGGNTTPAPFANEVHAYIQAILLVDPTAKFVALGAGLAQPDYSMPWVEELAKVDGHELSGISVHSYVLKGPPNPTDAELFANLSGPYSLPDQISADRSFIQTACPNCTNLQVFVTEINAAEDGSFETLIGTFAGTLYLAAETVQGLALNATNLDWFCYDCNYSGAWSEAPQKWQTQYFLFSDIMTHLYAETLPTIVTGPSTLYGIATYNGSGLALLLVNVNTTSAVSVNVEQSGFNMDQPGITEYSWVNGSELPTNSTVTLNGTVTLSPLSLMLLTTGLSSVPPYEVTFATNPSTCGTITFNGTGYTNGQLVQVTAGTYPVLATACTGYTLESLVGSGSVTVSSGTATVSGAGEITATFVPNPPPTYTVSFTETGLPSAAPWSATLGGIQHASTSNTITFTEPNGTYAYTITDISGWHQTTLPYTGTVTVSGVAVTEPTFVFTQVTYTVAISESTLPSGLGWSIALNGTTESLTTNGGTGTLTWTGLANGTYSYSITDISGWHQTTLPDSGTLTVNGGTNSISGSGIGYSKTLVYTQVTYTVTFTETGLPSGAEWWVNLTNEQTYSSVSTTITFSEPNGTYDYTVATEDKPYAPTPASSSFGVSGASVRESVTFSLITYTVTFTTSPSMCGTITFNGTPYMDGQSVLVPSGTYPVSATACKGYTLESLVGSGSVTFSSGTATVSGAGGITATFTAIPYTVTFTTSPSTCGTITFNGTAYMDGQSVLVTAGTYPVSAKACTDYTLESLVGSGSVTVSSGAATASGAGGITATFTAIPYTVTFTTSPSTCGTITFNGTAYTDGQSVQVTAGPYPVSAQPCTGYSRQSFAETGSVTVSSGTATVNGAGGITATFKAITVPTHKVTFTTSPSTCGTITFNGTSYTDGQSVLVTTGTYLVSATACTDYALESLVGSGSVTVSSGTATVSGAGKITVAFTTTSSSAAPGFLGFSGNLGYYLLGGIVAAVLVAIVSFVAAYRTKGKPYEGASTSGPGGTPSPSGRR